MKRKRIGLQTARLEYGYGVKIWQGAISGAEKSDLDLVLFPGRNLEAPHGFDYQYNRIFQLMTKENLDGLVLVTTLICNYVDQDRIREFCSRFNDFPVVSIGVSIPGLPSILIDNRSGVRSVVRHLAERHGAERIAFIKGPEGNWEASERFAAYREEIDRLGIAYDEKLVGAGDFTPYSVRPAIESILGRSERHPDAFVFANDEMAIRGMQLLKDRGIKVPETIAVTGFDDIIESSTQALPLTTVRQPQFEMGRLAVEMVGGVMEGRPAPETTILGTEPVIRSSCGCLFHTIEELRAIERRVMDSPRAEGPILALEALKASEFAGSGTIDARERRIKEVYARLEDASRSTADAEAFIPWFGDLLRDDDRNGLDPSDWQYILPAVAEALERVGGAAADPDSLTRLVRASMVLAAEMSASSRNALILQENSLNLVMREVQYSLSSVMNMEDLAEILIHQLPRLGIKTFFLSRFDSEWIHAPRTEWKIPDRIGFAAGLLDGKPLEAPADPGYPSSRIAPPSILGEKGRRTLAVYPLFFRDTHLGTIVYGIDQPNGHVYESMTTQIAGIMKTVMLFQGKERAETKLRQAMAELEGYNEQLNYLTLTDELTELYNRRGFMKLASQQLSIARQMRKKALLVFGDLDGLKKINDTYGHQEGDNAIKAAADVLKKTFRAMDIIARMGGDEFTVFVPNADESHIPLFRARIDNLIRENNQASASPYELSMSIGFVSCPPDAPRSLDDYIREADALLYEQKKAKRGG